MARAAERANGLVAVERQSLEIRGALGHLQPRQRQRRFDAQHLVLRLAEREERPRIIELAHRAQRAGRPPFAPRPPGR